MFCSKCGQEIPEGTKFCGNCGADNSVGKQFSEEASEVLQNTEKGISNAFEDVKATINNNGVPVMGERLEEKRELLPYVLLTLVTCGIYGTYYIYKLCADAQVTCDGDGETFDTSLAMFFVLTIITCGIYQIYQVYKLANRLANNAHRYNLSFQENGTTVLLWYVFGALLCCVGPFIAANILIKNTNALNTAYNAQNL